MDSCSVLRNSAKYEFSDGLYRTHRLSKESVYVLNVDEDTIAVFPVKWYKDSSAIVSSQRVNYLATQKRFKDNKTSHVFYKPSFDLDVLTIPLKYRPPLGWMPNQLTTNFNGALFAGYRIDEYRLHYKRTPLNAYKQFTRHFGYSAGLYAGIGGTYINQSVLNDPSVDLEYEGVLLITGVAISAAVEKFTFGLSFGLDHLMDKYHTMWIYQGQPCIGLTLGLNLN